MHSSRAAQWGEWGEGTEVRGTGSQVLRTQELWGGGGVSLVTGMKHPFLVRKDICEFSLFHFGCVLCARIRGSGECWNQQTREIFRSW